MSDLPRTRYVKSGEVHVAYQVLGDGPIDLLWVPGFVSHLEYEACLPLLPSLRQDSPRGHSAARLCADPIQCGSSGCGWNELRGNRSVGLGGVASGPARGTNLEDVSA